MADGQWNVFCENNNVILFWQQASKYFYKFDIKPGGLV